MLGKVPNSDGRTESIFPLDLSWHNISLLFIVPKHVDSIKSCAITSCATKTNIVSPERSFRKLLYETNWSLLSYFQMRSRISIRGCVRRSVGWSFRRSQTSWISEKRAEFEQNSIRNKKVCHLKDYSKTSTRAVRQRTHLLAELCSTCFLSN